MLLSDLLVNREIDHEDVHFFPPGDHASLSKLMEAALEEDPVKSSPKELVSKSNARLKRYGDGSHRAIPKSLALSLGLKQQRDFHLQYGIIPVGDLTGR